MKEKEKLSTLSVENCASDAEADQKGELAMMGEGSLKWCFYSWDQMYWFHFIVLHGLWEAYQIWGPMHSKHPLLSVTVEQRLTTDFNVWQTPCWEQDCNWSKILTSLAPGTTKTQSNHSNIFIYTFCTLTDVFMISHFSLSTFDNSNSLIIITFYFLHETKSTSWSNGELRTSWEFLG